MSSDALRECEIALCDIDAGRLKESGRILSAINRRKGGYSQIISYAGLENFEKALVGFLNKPTFLERDCGFPFRLCS